MKPITIQLLSLSLSLSLSFSLNLSIAQTSAELSALQVQKSAELAQLQTQLNELSNRVEGLQTEVEDLNDQLTPYPRWDVGALGNLGFSFSSFDNWLSKAQPNTTAFNIGFAANGFVNLEQHHYFWRNNANVTLGWLKFNDRDNGEDNNEFNVSADALAASSLFGYKLSEKLALSVMGEYRTGILDEKLNNPGYLDLGAGVTWTPITDLVVVVHPLNYNFIFSDSDFDFKSTLGTKVVVDYKRLLTKNLAWKTNLSAFASYEGLDYSNWTWTNSLTTAIKGLGIGIDFGLRQHEQEALSVDRTDNPLQSYWIVGLAYAL